MGKTAAIRVLLLYIVFIASTPGAFAQDTSRPQPKGDTSILRTVTVTGRKDLVKPTLDGFIYNAANDAAIAAGSAADILRRIPLVTVGQDGGLQVRGSSRVRVFIDNKPSDVYAASVADALRQIPAEDIATVEVVTQPSARYDAEGTDAVINIVTKKHRDDAVTGRLQGVLGNRNQSSGMGVKARKGAVIVSLDANWYRYNNTYRNTTERNSWENNKSFGLRQQRDGGNVMNTYVAGLTATWMIDSLHSIHAGYRYRHMRDRANSLLQTRYRTTDSVVDFQRGIDNRLRVLGNIFNTGYTGFSRNKKSEWSVLATSFFFREQNGYVLNQEDDGKVNGHEENDARLSNNVWILQADVVQHFNSGIKMEAGVKGVFRENRSVNFLRAFDVVDTNRSNRFEYDRDIYAGYLSYQYNFKSWSVRVGGRYEQCVMDIHVKDTAVQVPADYNWLPNVLISKTFGVSHTIKLSYAKKVERPYTFYLNPTVNYIDSLNIEYGNPALRPELIHSLQLVYNYNKGGVFASVSLFADYRRRTFGQVRLVEDGISAVTYRNMTGNELYGGNASINYNSGRKLQASAAVTVQHIELTNDAMGLRNSGFVVSANGRASYAFDKGFHMESAVQWEPRVIRLQGVYEGWFFYSLAMHKKWWKDRLTTSFTAENFLTRYQYRGEVLKGRNFLQRVDGRLPVGFFKLGVSWKFGKKEIKEPGRREVGE